LVLVVSDLVIDVAMLGPQGRDLGPRQTVPITTETATLWNAIEQLGEFDRITVVGADRNNLCEKIARQSQRPLRQMSHGELHWSRTIFGNGIELALTIGPRFGSIVYHRGVELPGLDLGNQLVRKDRRVREYLSPHVIETKGHDAWCKRVSRTAWELLAVWSPAALFLSAPPSLAMPDLPPPVVFVPYRSTLEDALRVWEPRFAQEIGDRP
jgi:hypothetical protein